MSHVAPSASASATIVALCPRGHELTRRDYSPWWGSAWRAAFDLRESIVAARGRGKAAQGCEVCGSATIIIRGPNGEDLT